MQPKDSNKPSEPTSSLLKKILVPALTIIFVIAISVGMWAFRHQIEALKQYAYLGVFVISLASSATVFTPVPGVVVFVPLLMTLNPVLVGVVGAAGSIIGEMTGYAAGRSGSSLASRGKRYEKVAGWMKKRGTLIVFLFAAVPILPMDLAGIVAGALRFPLWRFVLFGWLGKNIKYVSLMLIAAWGLDTIWPWISKYVS
jgi:membrane protein YqaA with SNARE-associated domain